MDERILYDDGVTRVSSDHVILGDSSCLVEEIRGVHVVGTTRERHLPRLVSVAGLIGALLGVTGLFFGAVAGGVLWLCISVPMLLWGKRTKSLVSSFRVGVLISDGTRLMAPNAMNGEQAGKLDSALEAARVPFRG